MVFCAATGNISKQNARWFLVHSQAWEGRSVAWIGLGGVAAERRGLTVGRSTDTLLSLGYE